MLNYSYKYSYNYMNNHIWISFVTHNIIRVIILGYTYNYTSRWTYILVFVLHTIIRVNILRYTYNYLSKYFNYTIITIHYKCLIQLYLYVYLRYTYKYMSTYTYFSICIFIHVSIPGLLYEYHWGHANWKGFIRSLQWVCI